MSLYLKYRPSDFSSLYGQEFTKQTLQKAIADDKTVGAYLFCGPRGTGKTSSARIFAKAINCLEPNNGNPCLECKVCRDFAEEKLVDIIEIDAASHTGVDNIREIIERAQFAPNFCKYKIYIIDEVHMLSKGAFNALLKILEEPPKHVKFILATTETHKVPETIISRCQRYDFKRISADDISARLQYIAQQENVTIDKKSLNYIVNNSGGGLRNAISLFEQLIVDKSISYNTITEKLGVVEDDFLDKFLVKLLKKDISIVDDYENIINEGKNIKIFFKELIFYTKNLALSQARKQSNISDYISILDILDETYGKTKNSLDENTTFLIGVLKIVSQYSQPNITTVSDNASGVNVKPVVSNSDNKIQNNQNSQEKIKVAEQVVQKNKQDISHEDVFDIFNEQANDDKSANIEAANTLSSSGSFDGKLFIDNLKTKGAKGALTMALRGSELSQNGSELIIKTKTKIAHGQISNMDNIGLMNQVLEAMNLQDLQIIVK